jgi:uncharacterized protein YlxW (UPF0749 family)
MSKQGVTIRLREELIDALDEEADEKDVSRSEYIREILHSRHEVDELQEQVETLNERLESREERVSQLETQLARRSQMEDKIEEVALEVREERDSDNAPFFVNWWNWWRDR